MTRLTSAIVATALLLVAAAALFAIPSPAEATEEDTIQAPISNHAEPDPVCNSYRHLELNQECASVNAPFKLFNGWICPELSEARFEGRYLQSDLPYNVAVVGIPDAIVWTSWCVRYFEAAAVPAATATPAPASPTPAQTPSAGCTVTLGVTVCPTPTSTPAPLTVPLNIPVFTG